MKSEREKRTWTNWGLVVEDPLSTMTVPFALSKGLPSLSPLLYLVIIYLLIN